MTFRLTNDNIQHYHENLLDEAAQQAMHGDIDSSDLLVRHAEIVETWQPNPNRTYDHLMFEESLATPNKPATVLGHLGAWFRTKF